MIVKFCGVPEQVWPPLVKVGVTVTVALIGAVPALVAVKAGSEPVPLAPSPMAVLLFDHEYAVVPPLRLVTKLSAGTAVPAQ